MNGIGDYLKRYIGAHTAFEQKKKVFIELVLSVLQIDISKKTIQFKDTVVIVSGLNSSERTVLFFKKQQLIKACSEKKIIITDIK